MSRTTWWNIWFNPEQNSYFTHHYYLYHPQYGRAFTICTLRHVPLLFREQSCICFCFTSITFHIFYYTASQINLLANIFLMFFSFFLHRSLLSLSFNHLTYLTKYSYRSTNVNCFATNGTWKNAADVGLCSMLLNKVHVASWFKRRQSSGTGKPIPVQVQLARDRAMNIFFLFSIFDWGDRV